MSNDYLVEFITNLAETPQDPRLKWLEGKIVENW